MFDNKWQKKEMPLVSLIGMGGGIASPAFLASIVLNILKPTVFSPVDDTGVPDFDYTAESSAITSVDQVVTAASTPTKGGQATFSSANIDYTDSTYDSNAERVIVAFRNGNLGYVSVGEVSGDSINYGTKVNFSNGQNCENITCTYDSNSQKIVVTYRTRDFSTYDDLMAVVGTTNPNNNSITFGTPVVIKSGGTEGGYHASCSIYDPNAQRVVHIYSDLTNSKKGTAQVLQVDGNSVIFGPRVIFSESQTFYPAVAYDTDTNQVILHYFGHPSSTSSSSRRSYVTLGTVSGNNISFGSSSIISPGHHSSYYALDLGLGYDPISQKVVAAWRYTDSSNNNYGTVAVGTVNGTDISFESGSGNEFLSTQARENMWIYDSASQKMVLVTHEDASPQSVKARIATISGNTITLSNPVEIEDLATLWHGITYDESNQRVVFSYKMSSNNEGRSTVISTTTSATQLTLTDTTVSKVSDGSLIGGTSIDQVLTVGETVRADTAVTSTVNDTVFSTTLYTGNGFDSNNNYLAIDTGIDNTHKSLIWIKNRDTTSFPQLFDNLRGPENYLKSSSDTQNQSGNYSLMSFTSNGFETSYNGGTNGPNERHVAWNFRAAPGFFDVVSYTGDGTGSQNISHDLGTTPGLIIVKRTDTTGDWWVYHSGLNAIGTASVNDQLKLNTTDAAGVGSFRFGQIGVGLDINSSSFTVGGDDFGPLDLNQSGATYIAYVFADDTPGLIKCGSYSSSGEVVNLGFRPQWIMIKSVDNTAAYTGDWRIYDTARGIVSGDGDASLYANEERVENTNIGASAITVNENGFTVEGQGAYGTSTIYIAIAESAEADVIENIYASGTVSASTGNTVTLSDVSGTWSTGMKVQGTDSDTKDNPDPISVENVSLTSSAPTAERNVNTWGDAVWEIATDENFTQNVQTATSALSATGTQAGPSFTLQPNTGYYTRTKYTALGQESEWSDVTYFVTKEPSVYADDVFSTNIWDGTGSTQTITNGIDLAGEGGLVWIKQRNANVEHFLFDTERGALKPIHSDQNWNEYTANNTLTSFNSNGYTLGSSNYVNGTTSSPRNYAGFTFRKAPGFFDVVTYTGNNYATTAIPHSLGSVPGMIIVKRLDAEANWQVYHRSTGNAQSGILSGNNAFASTNAWGSTSPTSTHFYVGNSSFVNGSSSMSYVAYVFAHDDQSFGTNSDEAIIKCGSYTTTGNGSDITVDLGFEPQFILFKSTASSRNWYIFDTMRGISVGGYDDPLYPNASHAETGLGTADFLDITSTGFIAKSGEINYFNSVENVVYMAIRRPHKPPTAATEVFAIDTLGGTSPTSPGFNSGFPVDMGWFVNTAGPGVIACTRLQGTKDLFPYLTNLEDSQSNRKFDYQNGWLDVNSTNSNYYSWMFRRAPGFFDVVTYTGVGSTQTVTHNLEVVPELIITKSRSTGTWWTYSSVTGNDGWLKFNENGASESPSNLWNYTTPSSTTFSLGNNNNVSGIGTNYIAYLFASLDGISKVGSYTGTGSNVDVDCGFAAGARFVLIKRTDSTGDWYIWDTARGITSGNDPYLLLNTNDAQVTNTDYLDPLNAGFTVTSSAPAALNASGGTYLFLAIA